MILIADSGSTKTHWKQIHADGSDESHYTKGLNPYFAGADIFDKVLSKDLPVDKNKIMCIHFYGAGCGADSKAEQVANFIKSHFPKARIYVYSDLLGAARALLGNNKGIACILGTGSVSCVYDGKKISRRTPSLGYILADEGGGASLGKELLKAYFYKKLPTPLHQAFEKDFNISREEVLDKVYRQPAPNAYLASFSKFIRANHQEPFIHNLVYGCFKEFFINHIIVYPSFKKLPLAFTGSVSSNLKDILAEVASELGASISKIMKEPMEGLVEYHRSQ
ncbi:MAG: ATPase [Bacteroidales bacterium]|nr:ATPase [Bacteroidales bacterium]